MCEKKKDLNKVAKKVEVKDLEQKERDVRGGKREWGYTIVDYGH